MENYQTPEDSTPLTVNISPSSDAQLDGPNEVRVTVYHEDTPKQWRKISVTKISEGEYEAQIDKSMLTDRPVVKIKTNLIVDSSQMPSKDAVVQNSEVDYTFNGGSNPADFESRFSTDSSEYDDGSDTDETFSITKKVAITLT
ncbi:hypothetical protein POV27_00065 [Aureisphaera galaxeae]|uniref:hypothetical protein n=1 Tax=Aureisphaera galaxeae TaxID=1538023 RepID=UPI00235054FE|nr:hypothetical protein [Aureisphaera galaxeae]MDC8002430.1 hypothetical protein [Aureisphaera galaxeae]